MAADRTEDDEPLEVILAEDHLMMRRGIELLLRDAGFRIAGVAEDVAQCKALLARRRYDVALLDIHLDGATVLPLVEELFREDPMAPVVLYTGFTSVGSGLHEAAQAGARGFVLKTSPPERLLNALRAVADGGTYVDPALATALAADRDLMRLDTLTAREREVLQLLAEGLNGRRISERLVVSPETVRTHVRNATVKLEAKTRVQAVAMVVRARGPM
jgi:DNA-binding NarL/FixJ family response regulator